ncbi:hypothetical protein PoB_001700300 [Plakobranchus ocellatus]|uniref:Uncharacterized protein n=1 Tax=Plakobranchus ocellatus TaxID=259542 RepID=A0AAV3Z720_9GAST|nr:hypothetical protein PoB_001700300 [Plakobranchus ocellatus]
MILVGNGLVVLALTLTKSRKSRMHVFILNLAIAAIQSALNKANTKQDVDIRVTRKTAVTETAESRRQSVA